MIWYVAVGVALQRPPRFDATRLLSVEADNATDAHLVAAQMASCTSTMPVWTEIVGDEECPPLPGWEYGT